MKVRVRFVALFRDLAGVQEEAIELPEGSTLGDLVRELSKRHPPLSEYLSAGDLVAVVDGKATQLNERLRDGCEVVMMPPISGGSSYGFLDRVEPQKLLDAFLSSLGDEVGAVAVFIGRVKGSVDGKRVRELEYEVMEPQATEALARIWSEEVEKHSLSTACIYHKKGVATPGEPVLFIAVASKGRREALSALMEILERVKHEAFVWKLEKREDGDYWILGDARRVRRPQAL